MWPQPIVPTPGIRPNQFADRMKMKIVAKNQKVSLDQVRTDDAFEEIVEPFDQPLQEVLRAARDTLPYSASRAARRRSRATPPRSR